MGATALHALVDKALKVPFGDACMHAQRDDSTRDSRAHPRRASLTPASTVLRMPRSSYVMVMSGMRSAAPATAPCTVMWRTRACLGRPRSSSRPSRRANGAVISVYEPFPAQCCIRLCLLLLN